MENLARCPRCTSMIVAWNWIHTSSEYAHECWICDHLFYTKNKVLNGISSYEARRAVYENWKKTGKEEYTEAMKVLYGK